MKYQNYQTISIKKTRDELADIIEQVATGGKTFAVTKFGKVKALITPVDEVSELSKKEKLDRLYEGLLKMKGIGGSGVTDASTTIDDLLYDKGFK